MRLSEYAKCLSGAELIRYRAKVVKCGGEDPLALYDGELTGEVRQYPCVDRADIYDYLVNATSFVTRDQLKSYKSLQSHNYLTSGFVQQPKVKVLANGNVVVVGKVSRTFTRGLSRNFCSFAI